MPSICPNCLRPVRMEAKYCGFCGSNLHPEALDEASAALPVKQLEEETKQEENIQVKPKTDRAIIQRRILIFIIILLCLVLLVTFLIHYWPLIGRYANSIIALIFTR